MSSCCAPTRSRLGGYPFAPGGERSVARGYTKALRRARSLIYVEDQYLWSHEVARRFAEALRDAARAAADRGAAACTPTRTGGSRCRRTCSAGDRALRRCCATPAADRVAVYGIENHAGRPVYVHAKVCVVDDVWATVGSDNFNRRSWTHDSELSAAVLDETRDRREPRDPGGLGDGARVYARDLRLRLMREHLDRDAIRRATTPCSTRRPPSPSSAGRPRPWRPGTAATAPARARPAGCARWSTRTSAATTRRWATVLYHWIYDPDGRPAALRRRHTF